MFLDIDGNKVFALSFGSASRTILAHSGWIGNFEDWIATLAPLSATWRTAVYDHRGTGETAVPVDRITSEALVDDVFRVMDALAIDRCVLAGFSRGVATVLQAALRTPDRFEGLVLANGAGGVQRPEALPRQRMAPSTWPGETFRDHLQWFIERCTPEPDVQHIRRWGVNILSRATPEAADRIFLMEPAQPIDWSVELKRVTMPTLLLQGDKDPLCDTGTMRYLASLIPNSKLVVFENCGHLPAMVRPQEVAAEINSFFDGEVT